MPQGAPLPGPTVAARLVTDAATAQTLLAALADSLDGDGVATGVFEEPDGRWTVALHFAAPPSETAVRALVALASDAATANAMTFETLAAADWVTTSLEGLTPVAAGRFVIHGAHDRAKVPPNRIGIEIEAALAFGTGHHGTTRGCLLALDRLLRSRRPRRVVLDVGTGTGVLAIAAARTLRTRVIASDNDRSAVRVARENARLNHAAALVETVHAAGANAHRFRVRGPYGVIFANILLGPLKPMARPIVRLAAPEARVILSGLLPSHANAASAAYRAAGLVLERTTIVDGWATLQLARRTRPRRRDKKSPGRGPGRGLRTGGTSIRCR